MHPRLKAFAQFALTWTAAIYLLTPVATLLLVGGDALLPYESVGCTAVSAAFFYQSAKHVWRTI